MADNNEDRGHELYPWWFPGWPDARTMVALGFFALAGSILNMIWAKPELTQNQGFMLLAQAIIISGLIGAVAAFFFTASKEGADKNKTIADMSRASATLAETAAAAVPDKPAGAPAADVPIVETPAGPAVATADVGAAPAGGELPPEERITP
jgi:hypothetical protein